MQNKLNISHIDHYLKSKNNIHYCLVSHTNPNKSDHPAISKDVPLGRFSLLSTSENVDLSSLRAASVKTILELGLSNNRCSEKVIFVPVGYGSSKPIIFYSRPMDQPKNRRIDFRFSLQKGWERNWNRNHD